MEPTWLRSRLSDLILIYPLWNSDCLSDNEILYTADLGVNLCTACLVKFKQFGTDMIGLISFRVSA